MTRRMPWGLTAVVLITGFPILEIALLVEIGRRIGTWWAVGIVIGTGLLGGLLLTLEGYRVLGSIRRELSSGRFPKDHLIDGALVVIGAIMLITPGVITDTLGILLMFPPTRLVARLAVKRWISKYIYLNF